LLLEEAKCPSINGYFPQSLRQIRILILEILFCIPVVNPDDVGTSSLILRKLSHFWRETRRLPEDGYFPQSLRQAQILILEILQCIPVVIIFAFLDLGKNISSSDRILALNEQLSNDKVMENWGYAV
jgi:hypothetical protein